MLQIRKNIIKIRLPKVETSASDHGALLRVDWQRCGGGTNRLSLAYSRSLKQAGPLGKMTSRMGCLFIWHIILFNIRWLCKRWKFQSRTTTHYTNIVGRWCGGRAEQMTSDELVALLIRLARLANWHLCRDAFFFI